jgi:hypothetical protein
MLVCLGMGTLAASSAMVRGIVVVIVSTNAQSAANSKRTPGRLGREKKQSLKKKAKSKKVLLLP